MDGDPGDEEDVTDEAGRHDGAASDTFIERAASIPLGGWLEIIEEDGTRIRAKLSWKSPVGDVYVFVNRKGLKVAELNIHALASLFRRSRAEILEDPQVPAVERALALMTEKLREEESARPTRR